MTWHKRDDDYATSPKIVAAGEDGALVFEVLLAINSRWRRDGKLTAIDAAPTAIRARLGVFRRSVVKIEAALEACVGAGLIQRNADKGVSIIGWDDEWKPRAPVPGNEEDYPGEQTGGEMEPPIPSPISSSSRALTAAERQRLWRERQRNGVTETVTDRNGDRNGAVTVRNENRNATVTQNVTDRNAPRARASDSGSGRLEERREELARSSDAHARETANGRADAPARSRASEPLSSATFPESEQESGTDLTRTGAGPEPFGSRNGQESARNPSAVAPDYAALRRAVEKFNRDFPREEEP